MVQHHNAEAARAWGHSGVNYNFISFGLSDSLSHAVQVLWPKPGEHILDVATGTGWTARLAAELGAKVTGVDIADPLLEAARGLSAHLADNLSYQHGDAEALPFDDGAFDGVISTYGVIFAAMPDAVISELARVTKKGGRMVLVTWLDDPEGYISKFFSLVGRYADTEPPKVSPFVWGNRDWIETAFSGSFDVTSTAHSTTLFAPDAETLWQKYRGGFGPMDLVAKGLSPARLASMRQEFHDIHARYDNGQGLRIDRAALLVQGRRL